MTVWKLPLPVEDAPVLTLPKGARLLRVAVQDKLLHLWALVDPAAPRVGRWLRVMETGHELLGPSSAPYVGAVMMYGGYTVLHVFDFGEVTEEQHQLYLAGESLLFAERGAA